MTHSIQAQKSSFHRELEGNANLQKQLYVWSGMKMLERQLAQIHPITSDTTLLTHLSTLLSNLEFKEDLI